jgi:steroid 5-alpha reductase family enzyme
MWKTALLLIFALIVVPIVAFNFDEPLTDLQQTTLNKLLWVYGIAAAACFVISTITNNYSQVDKLWSVIPVPYVWIVAVEGEFENRLVLMAVLVTIWAIRLTYNFNRRGGYSWKFWEGEEDYRWAILRQKPGLKTPFLWLLFNLFFISIYQMGLILLMRLPTVKSMNGGDLTIFDALIALIFIGFVVMEYFADEQQWQYQTEKYRRKNAGEPLGDFYGKGFTHTGLWGKMRHPNYTAEQSIWLVFYFFSVIATGNWLNWSVVGCLLLLLLFKGSSDFSEAISAEKYSEYADYQKRVARFIPFLK